METDRFHRVKIGKRTDLSQSNPGKYQSETGDFPVDERIPVWYSIIKLVKTNT